MDGTRSSGMDRMRSSGMDGTRSSGMDGMRSSGMDGDALFRYGWGRALQVWMGRERRDGALYN